MPYTRRLDWHRTYPEKGRDYWVEIRDSFNTKIAFARVVHEPHVSSDEKWSWTASRDTLIGGGYVLTPEEAIRLAEEALLGPETQKADAAPEGTAPAS